MIFAGFLLKCTFERVTLESDTSAEMLLFIYGLRSTNHQFFNVWCFTCITSYNHSNKLIYRSVFGHLA